ncbi:MAG: hypothetical protein IJ501_03585 [Bacilli bacterium]|nr:hypothetical protein [Bacilli bacterium]
MKNLNEKQEILDSIENFALENEEIPFPQANSFDLVLKTLNLVYSNVNSALLISQCIGYAEREGKYYIDALRYLGLAEKSQKDGNYYLTEDGFLLCACVDNRMNYRIIFKILEHEVFYKTFKYVVNTGEIPSIEIICKYMIENGIVLSDDTLRRRASTVKGWIQWLMDVDIYKEV